MNKTKHILSCDWGTSSFRLRLVNVNDKTVIDEIASSNGNAVVYEEWLKQAKDESVRLVFYKSILQSFIAELKHDVKDVPVIISGMASSTIGMKELGYTALPFSLSPGNLNTFLIHADKDCKHDILLVSGIKTNNDVMRGEETMLLGCDFKNDNNVVLIFPGTHSKHVQVTNNVAVDFKTYMTGEFFELLSIKSLMAKSVMKNNPADEKNFIEGVKDGSSNNILNASFHVRTNQLFKKNTAAENYHYLSGLLIGNELSDLLKEKHQSVMVVANNALMKLYSSALKTIDSSMNVSLQDADDALINGHVLIYNHY